MTMASGLPASVPAAKAALRAQLRVARTQLDPAERARSDTAIAEQVVASDAFRRAAVVFAYLSFGTEVETRAIISAAWEAGKVVALPRVQGDRALQWYRVDSFEGLVKSPYGMDEPAPDARVLIDPVHPEEAVNGPRPSGFFRRGDCRALALVPGLAFDHEGYRLGYGGGYYDAFLGIFSGVSFGLCRPSELFSSLDVFGVLEPHDCPVTTVITA